MTFASIFSSSHNQLKSQRPENEIGEELSWSAIESGPHDLNLTRIECDDDIDTAWNATEFNGLNGSTGGSRLQPSLERCKSYTNSLPLLSRFHLMYVSFSDLHMGLGMFSGFRSPISVYVCVWFEIVLCSQWVYHRYVHNV